MPSDTHGLTFNAPVLTSLVTKTTANSQPFHAKTALREQSVKPESEILANPEAKLGVGFFLPAPVWAHMKTTIAKSANLAARRERADRSGLADGATELLDGSFSNIPCDNACARANRHGFPRSYASETSDPSIDTVTRSFQATRH